MSKFISLSQGEKAIVDDDDFEELNKYKWSYLRGYASRSVRTKNGKRTRTSMHIQIMGKIQGYQIDHINHCGIDNRKENLRFATYSQNQMNRIQPLCFSSKYKGVDWHKRDGCWRAHIVKDKKQYYIGHFKSEIDAADAYNKKAIELFGDFACLNVIPYGRNGV